MAQRRMFTMQIVDSDAFLDMPLSAQALYFHLNMRADDDGFINNPRKIQRMINASDDDLRVLIAKRFLLAFESGVIVVKHWRMHNILRRDRYTPTQYQEELAQLGIKDNGAYTESGNQLATTWQPVGNQLEPQVRIGKESKGKDSIGEGKSKFAPPTLDEVKAYCEERKSPVDPVQFWNYFTEGNWTDAKGNRVRNWKQKLLTWERFQGDRPAQKKQIYGYGCNDNKSPIDTRDLESLLNNFEKKTT